MVKNSTEEQISEMFNTISPSYDRVNHILSFGVDRLWRKTLAKHLPKGSHLSLLDLATGTCDQLLSLFRVGQFDSAMGIDLSEGMLKRGREKVDQSPFRDQVELKVASALDIPVQDGSFDCATISFGIRNVNSPLQCLKEMHRVLSQDGRCLILEFSLPKNRAIKAFHLFYLRKILPRVGGWISGEKSAYSYLNETIETFPYGDNFLHLMREAGFKNPKALPLSFGIATLYIGERA